MKYRSNSGADSKKHIIISKTVLIAFSIRNEDECQPPSYYIAIRYPEDIWICSLVFYFTILITGNIVLLQYDKKCFRYLHVYFTEYAYCNKFFPVNRMTERQV